jgi:hypothetical protein
MRRCKDNEHHTLFRSMPPETNDNQKDTIIDADGIASQTYTGDPRKALEQFGSLFSQVQSIVLEGGAWDAETLEIKTQNFIRTYLQIFVPGLGYALTSFVVLGSTFFSCFFGLNLSGRGYNDIVEAVSAYEPLRALLEKADPAWGNVAIALLGCELLSPVILAATLALTPRTMDLLQGKLDEIGWGEDDIEERTADILRLTG